VSVWPLQISCSSRSIIRKQYVNDGRKYHWAEEGFCDYPERQGATTTFEGDDEDSRLGPQLLKLNHAPARSCRNRFCAAQYVELGENTLEVSLNRGFADEQMSPDFLVALSGGQIAQHNQLSLGQLNSAHSLRQLCGD